VTEAYVAAAGPVLFWGSPFWPAIWPCRSTNVVRKRHRKLGISNYVGKISYHSKFFGKCNCNPRWMNWTNELEWFRSCHKDNSLTLTSETTCKTTSMWTYNKCKQWLQLTYKETAIILCGSIVCILSQGLRSHVIRSEILFSLSILWLWCCCCCCFLGCNKHQILHNNPHLASNNNMCNWS